MMLNMDTLIFTVAGVTLRLKLPHPIEIGNNFRVFLGDSDTDHIIAEFNEVDSLPLISGEPIFRNLNFTVYPHGEEYVRVFHDEVYGREPYAYTVHSPEKEYVTVQYLSKKRQYFLTCQNCFFYLALEELLLSRGRLILHASFISSVFGGILFSGPSGIGKSTQAQLWESMEGSTVINGDKPILGKCNGVWNAYGSPYAGSSQCYVNESLPIAAIVMLEQGKSCSIRRLGQAEAFRCLYAGTVINSWNSAYVQHVCDLLSDISVSIPVYHMICTPDYRAVETVKAELAKKENK